MKKIAFEGKSTDDVGQLARQTSKRVLQELELPQSRHNLLGFVSRTEWSCFCMLLFLSNSIRDFCHLLSTLISKSLRIKNRLGSGKEQTELCFPVG